jgi:photosystem II stability/assembly factor-like uncharacterized protein
MTKIKLLFSLFLMIFILTGCSLQLGSNTTNRDGALFISTDQGDNWQQRASVPTATGNPKSIAMLDGYSLAMDPSDSKTLYYGTIDNGLYYSYTKTSDWQYAKTLGQVTIRAIAADYEDRCTVYVAVANRVLKTTDCSRSWTQVYYDNDKTVTINTIAVDHYDSKNVYLGTSRGEVIKSLDKGGSWQTKERFKSAVRKIVISPQDSRMIFAATQKKGIFRSDDSGEKWLSLAENLKSYKTSTSFRDIAVSKSDIGVVYLASDYGLLRSDDNGDNWSQIDLITPEKEKIINSFTVSPKSASEIYYVTNTTFYRSSDGGKNWVTKKLPSSRAGWQIMVDSDNTKIIYLIVKTYQDKKNQTTN